jgi:hypothetical protein
MAQVVKHLPSKLEALNSNTITTLQPPHHSKKKPCWDHLEGRHFSSSYKYLKITVIMFFRCHHEGRRTSNLRSKDPSAS